MPEVISRKEPPKGLSRLIWRAPIWIYRLGLGGLMGGRFLLLHHTGRKSGLPRQVALEVVQHDESQDIYAVVSAFGPKADWYQNVLKTPQVEIEVGRKKSPRTAVPMESQQAGRAMVDYAHRNPRAAKTLMGFIGFRVDGSDEDYFILGRDHLLFVELRAA